MISNSMPATAADSDSASLGSNPSPPAILNPSWDWRFHLWKSRISENWRTRTPHTCRHNTFALLPSPPPRTDLDT